MVYINTKIKISIPVYCPKCDHKLNHVNALDSKAKVYLVYCPNSGCRFAREFKKCPNCGELICV